MLQAWSDDEATLVLYCLYHIGVIQPYQHRFPAMIAQPTDAAMIAALTAIAAQHQVGMAQAGVNGVPVNAGVIGVIAFVVVFIFIVVISACWWKRWRSNGRFDWCNS